MIKFLHSADWHLDSAFSALSPEKAALRREEQRELIGRIFSLANEQDCDLVLLAGDLFDSDNAYADTIAALLEGCKACRSEIVIAPGNHDCCISGSTYTAQKWPQNVHIFSEGRISFFEFPRLSCRVYGAAFTKPYENSFLDGFHADCGDMLPLMVLHGDTDTPNSNYNAVSKEQIAASGLRYLALGHIHERSALQKAGETFYAYCGCPMGRGFDELGEKGVLIGTADENSCKVDFVPLGGRKYELLRVDAGDDALRAIERALPPDTQNDIYRIILTGESAPISVAAIECALQDRFFGLSVRDETRPKRALWQGSEENTLRGGFLRKLRELYDAAQTEDERRVIAQAAKIGADLMDGAEVTV